MADEKITQIQEGSAIVDADLWPLVQNVSTTPVTRAKTGTQVKTWLGIHVGSSAPGSPTAGMLWWDTTNKILWTYGTYAGADRWVSANLFTTGALNGSGTVGANFINTAVGSEVSSAGYDVYIDTLFWKHHVLTTNNGSNYWTITLRKVSSTTAPAAGAGSALGTLNTSASSAGVWSEVTAVIDVVIDTTGADMEILFYDCAKTGSPGNMWDTRGVSYRLVRS